MSIVRLDRMAGRVNLAWLVLAASLALSCAVLLGGSARNERHARTFVKRHKPTPFLPSAGLKDKLANTKPFSFPSDRVNVRNTRSDDERVCGLRNSLVLETDAVSHYLNSISSFPSSLPSLPPSLPPSDIHSYH